MMALQARNVNVKLGGTGVLHGVSVDFPAGKWTCLVGPNGAGKSSLLRALAGLLPCTGEIHLMDRRLTDWPNKQRAQTLAWLGQHELALDDLLVWDVVMLGRLPHRDWFAPPSAQDYLAVEQALRMTQAFEWKHRSLGQLSGGERQRVLLARVLAVQAKLVLMDEPLVNLDPPHQVDWLHIVRELVRAGTTVVSVLHEVSMALQADELVVMDKGRVLHQGSAQERNTHAAVEAVFGNSLTIQRLEGQCIALPRLEFTRKKQ
jgi:iron complex transport system ATP-binding protein